MKKQLTKNQYVMIDMIILAVLVLLLEAASRLALNFFRTELFTISVVLPITLIAMMRHGALGVAIASFGGLVYCIVNGADAGVYIVYMLGNSFIAANLLWFRNSGKMRLVASTGKIALYVFTGYFFMNLGRGLCTLIIGNPQFLGTMVRYFTTDALSAVMAFVIIMIARNQDGVFEDQMEYLKRQADKEEKGYAG